MVLTYCELSTDQRKKLFEYFVMEVTACSAANVMGIYANSTAPFYHK
jgi:transposase